MDKERYKELLQYYLDKGFKFVYFSEYVPTNKKQILLRHDVLFDVDLAIDMAKIENELGIKANYFFLTHGIYNFNTILFDLLKHMGHYSGLLVDYSIMQDKDVVFQNYHAIRNPSKKQINSKVKFSTYNRLFHKDIAYYTDEGAIEPKKIRGNGQLVIHPYLWMLDGDTLDDKLMRLEGFKEGMFAQYVEKTLNHEKKGM